MTTSERSFRVALWSPLPPLKTGVADYVAELLPYLNQEFDLEIFVDANYQVSDELRRAYSIFPYSSYPERDALRSFDLNVYQMGNNAYHLYMYEQALRVPGLVVLHDLSISFALYHYYAGIQHDLEKFRREFEYSEGEEARKEFDRLYASGDGDAMLRFFSDKYMLRRLSERSYAMLTHLSYALDLLKSRYQARQAFSMYLGAADPFEELPGVDQTTARQRLGIAEKAFLIGVFGYLQATKQNDVTLRAFARLRSRYPQAQLIFVGEINPANHYDQYLDSLIRKLRLENHVHITGYVPREVMQTYYFASDVVVNLRYPSFGQMSATLARAIASGKPLIVTDLPEWRFLPEEFCWRVPGEDKEGTVLLGYLETLIRERDLVLKRGQAARRYYLENGTLAIAAQKLSQIIRQVIREAPEEFPTREDADFYSREPSVETMRRLFEIWDSLRAGGRLARYLTNLRRVPILGKPLYYLARMAENILRSPEIRRAEWQLFHAFVEEISQLRGEVAQLRGELRQEYQPKAIRVLADPLGLIPDYQRPTFPPDFHGDRFYTALEAAFRGAPGIIRERQRRVWEQIKSTLSVDPEFPILDVGCGRGEFLSLLHQEGYRVIGLDINPTFLPGLSQQGIEVYHQEALDYLRGLPDCALQGIVAFHVIEHLDHPTIMQLLWLAYQKLMPGGFIYIETPNPVCFESLSKFYTDPTHHRPIQPFQLAFLLEYHGFENIRLLFLEPVKTRGTLSEERWMTLYQDCGALASRPRNRE